VAAAAQAVADAAQLPVSDLRSAREVPDALVVDHVADEAPGTDALVRAAVRHARAALEEMDDVADGGRVALIAPAALVGPVREAIEAAGLGAALGTGASAMDAPLIVLTPRQSKGLEFDVVVLVEPAAVLAASAGDLYVAMTRPTRRLRVVHRDPLPAGWPTDANPAAA
jgi:superfamily I DNA/RNA helicase